jgi:hypothetical protein
MATANVRLSRSAHQALRELAKQERTTIQAAAERAIENYRRQRFLEAANRTYAALRNDPDAWRETLAEREVLDGASYDGLDD